MALPCAGDINKVAREISHILSDCAPSIYLYGSTVLGDFSPGWSDIDILVLTDKQMSKEQAQRLVTLRQTLLREDPENPYYRSFEGGMLTLRAFLSGDSDRVVYWGSSGERITDTYSLDCFGLAELMEQGILLHGKDVRSKLQAPSFSELYAGVKCHYITIRKHVRQTKQSLYSFGWLLDIARCLYTLETGKIISKTAAAAWALENNLCPDPDILKTACKVRKDPLLYKAERRLMDEAETLAEPIQRFADILERELENIYDPADCIPRKA